jgi:hypothetical protein
VRPASFASEPLMLPNGIAGYIVRVDSRNPIDYGPMLKGEPGSNVSLSAQIFMPKNAQTPVPAIIVTPGSGNIGPHHVAHAARLTSAGYAVMILDPFTARQVKNTVADQSLVSWAGCIDQAVPGALHAFDRELPKTVVPEAVTSTVYPTVYMNDEGQYFNMRTGRVDPALTKAMFDGYAVKGGFYVGA